jgi:hypothetical protein
MLRLAPQMAGDQVGLITHLTKESPVEPIMVKNTKDTSSKKNYEELITSHPILHEIIKAHLVYDAKAILSFCSTLPQLKRSRIFLPSSPHYFFDARQEWFVGGMQYPADAVWRFSAKEFTFPSYYIIHEVKTGRYDISEEMKKHYIHHNHVSLYLWAYKKYHNENKHIPYSFVKQLDITSLKKYITHSTIQIINKWGEY